jgi:TPR repeat protein
MTSAEAQAAFEEGRRTLPDWRDQGPDVDARYEAAQRLIAQAAEAGHLPAVMLLADGMGGAETPRWAIRAAEQGETGPLQSVLTDTDWPPEVGRGVLEAARAGRAWAMLCVAFVYASGLRSNVTGVLAATTPDAYGWLPAVVEPGAEASRWFEAAAATGWAPAAFSLALRLQVADAPRALALVQAALARGAELPPRSATRAGALLLELLERTEAPLDLRLAIHHERAAGGDADAAAWLAARYLDGDGVAKDVPRARALFQMAAESGHVGACRELGKLCEQAGEPDRARELYERAAELGADAWSRRRLVERFGLSWYGT